MMDGILNKRGRSWNAVVLKESEKSENNIEKRIGI
jgi:hypothetical protein